MAPLAAEAAQRRAAPPPRPWALGTPRPRPRRPRTRGWRQTPIPEHRPRARRRVAGALLLARQRTRPLRRRPRTPLRTLATRQPRTSKTPPPRVRRAMRFSTDPVRTKGPTTRPWTTHAATSQSIPSTTGARERGAMARRLTPTLWQTTGRRPLPSSPITKLCPRGRGTQLHKNGGLNAASRWGAWPGMRPALAVLTHGKGVARSGAPAGPVRPAWWPCTRRARSP